MSPGASPVDSFAIRPLGDARLVRDRQAEHRLQDRRVCRLDNNTQTRTTNAKTALQGNIGTFEEILGCGFRSCTDLFGFSRQDRFVKLEVRRNADEAQICRNLVTQLDVDLSRRSAPVQQPGRRAYQVSGHELLRIHAGLGAVSQYFNFDGKHLLDRTHNLASGVVWQRRGQTNQV